MFEPYTPIDRCVGKEVRARCGGDDYVGLLAGVYTSNGMVVLVLTPLSGQGLEQHIPLQNAVVSVKP